MIEEGGKEGIEQDNRELRSIVAYNNIRSGLTSGQGNKEGSGVSGDEKLCDSVRLYRSDTYPKEVFAVLKGFLDSSLLTDLTLITGQKYQNEVHSPVLAAVSSFIREKLRCDGKEQSGYDTGVQKRTVTLGPEVDQTGLQAVVEFAYTGAALSLSQDNVAQIKSAAQALGVPRLLDLCNKKERTREDGNARETEKKTAQEEMKITLKSIHQLWEDKLGCDVILDVDHGTLFHGKWT